MEDWQRKVIREAVIWGAGIAIGRVIIGLIMHRLEEREVSYGKRSLPIRSSTTERRAG